MKFWDHQADARSETRKLLLGFAVAVVVLVAAVHAALALAWWLMAMVLPVHLPPPEGFLVANVGLSLMLVLGGWWLETSNLRAGGVKLAKRIGARELRPSLSLAEQRLSNIVDELCIAAHMPRPQVMVVPRTDAINAFAAGWDESDAVIAVTQGALDYLTRDEMQGMVAHELSHLHEGDTRLKMQLAGMVFGLELVHNFGDTVRERPGLAWWFGSAVKVAGFAGWLTGRILKAAVSRQREYLADARAVQWTRSRDGLGGVLRKVMTQRVAAAPGYEGPSHVGLHHPTVQHMLLVDVETVGFMARWLHTHPTLEERVQRLYGRRMLPLPVEVVTVEPEGSPRQTGGGADASAQQGPTIASLVDPYARFM
jgi:Zn-dependent protease with chaperone function